jgi:TatA/E family protein of Tat protein translocase
MEESMHQLALAMFFAPQDMMLVLVVALLIFGPKRLPELGEGLGKGIRGFKDAVNGDPEPKALPAEKQPEPQAAIPHQTVVGEHVEYTR